MKGADQCPKCGSRKTADINQAITGFYAGEIRVCGNCGTAWEPFDEVALLDAGDPLSSFVEPCDNCAFRPGSTEQSDKDKWQELMTSLKENGSAFYCHKGVPIAPGSEDGFAYPRDDAGRPVVKKLRICRGYLRMLKKNLGKEAAKHG